MQLRAHLVATLSLSVLLCAGAARAQTAAPPAHASQVFVEAVVIELDAAALDRLMGGHDVADVASLTVPGDPDGEPVPGGRAVSRVWSALHAQGDAALRWSPSFLAAPDAWATVTLGHAIGALVFTSAPPDDLTLRLQLRPRLDDTGSIHLDITQAGTTRSDGPIVVRGGAVHAEVVVGEGRPVLLRGLTLDRAERGDGGSILGELPLLGALLPPAQPVVRRRALALVVTPHVIACSDDLHAIFRARMRERQDYLDRMYLRSDAIDDRPPADYARTRGLVEEIHRSRVALAQPPRTAP